MCKEMGEERGRRREKEEDERDGMTMAEREAQTQKTHVVPSSLYTINRWTKEED